MSAAVGTSRRATGFAHGLTAAQAALAQALDEQHLAATGRDALARSRFVAREALGLANLERSGVVLLRGSAIVDLSTFCALLAPALGLERIRRTVDGPGGVVQALRHRAEPEGRFGPAGSAAGTGHRRYIIWDDAHVLLKRDASLFGDLVDAIHGASAELEFLSDDVLLLQRAVYVGTPALAEFAESRAGPFARWRRGSRWAKTTGLRGPIVGRWTIAS